MSRRDRDPSAALALAEPLLWLALAAAVLFVNPYAELGPEADRWLLLQATALVAGALALAGILRGRATLFGAETVPAPAAVHRSSLDVAAGAWLLAITIASLASIDRWRSFPGAPPRLAGWASAAAAVALFAVARRALASRAGGRAGSRKPRAAAGSGRRSRSPCT